MGGIEPGTGPLGPPTSQLHDCFVVVADGEERGSSLLGEDPAGFVEPGDGLVEAAGHRAEAGQ